MWSIAGFWETIHITSNTAEICWQGWNYVEINLKEAIRYPKALSASVSRAKNQIHWLLLLFTVAAYKIPQIWQCISHIHFKSMSNMLCFFPNHHQMHIPLLEICPLNDLLLLNTFISRRKEFWICYQKQLHYFTLQWSNMKNFITGGKQLAFSTGPALLTKPSLVPQLKSKQTVQAYTAAAAGSEYSNVFTCIMFKMWDASSITWLLYKENVSWDHSCTFIAKFQCERQSCSSDK